MTDEQQQRDKLAEFEKMLQGLTPYELAYLLAIARRLQAQQQSKRSAAFVPSLRFGGPDKKRGEKG